MAAAKKAKSKKTTHQKASVVDEMILLRLNLINKLAISIAANSSYLFDLHVEQINTPAQRAKILLAEESIALDVKEMQLLTTKIS